MFHIIYRDLGEPAPFEAFQSYLLESRVHLVYSILRDPRLMLALKQRLSLITRGETYTRLNYPTK